MVRLLLLTRAMKRALVVLTLAAVAACSAAPVDDEAADDQALSGDGADGVVFASDSVKSFELTLAPADMKTLSDQADAVTAQKISAFAERPKAKGTFTYKGGGVPVTPTCDVTKPYAVSVKIKGMASVQGFDKKPSLRIDFDEAFCGLKNLTLNNLVQDDSLVNETLAYEMYRSMGVPVPRSGYSQVSVNGTPMGVYLTLESIDKNFLKRSFEDASGPIYEGTYGADLRLSDIGTEKLQYGGSDKLPEATDAQQLKAFIAAVNAPGDAVFYGSPPQVDTNQFLNMMATAYVIGDWDNYITANNYRMYRSPKTNLWSFIPTGTDQTFNRRLHPYRGFLERNQGFSVLFEKCMGSARCLHDYEERLGKALTKLTADSGALATTGAQRASLIAAAVKSDTRRPQNDAQIAAARAALPSFIAARAADIGAATKCMSGGKEIFRGACAGLVLRNAADQSRCLDSFGANDTDGAPINSFACHGRTNQRVFVKPIANDEVEVHITQSDKCLDVPAQRLDDGLQLQQFTCNGGPNQRFTAKPGADGVQLVVKHSGKCVAPSATPSESTPIVQTPCTADRGQVWTLHGSLFD